MSYVLGIDCSERIAHVALVRFQSAKAEVLEQKVSGERGSAEETTTMICQVLAGQELSATSLTAVCVAVGPGSYTGIRAAIASAQGLAAANRTLVIGASTLLVRALGSGHSGEAVLVCLKAIAEQYFSLALEFEQHIRAGELSFEARQLSSLEARNEQELTQLELELSQSRAGQCQRLVGQRLVGQRLVGQRLVVDYAESGPEVETACPPAEGYNHCYNHWGPAALLCLASRLELRALAGSDGAEKQLLLQRSDCGIGLAPCYGKKPAAKTLLERNLHQPATARPR